MSNNKYKVMKEKCKREKFIEVELVKSSAKKRRFDYMCKIICNFLNVNTRQTGYAPNFCLYSFALVWFCICDPIYKKCFSDYLNEKYFK